MNPVNPDPLDPKELAARGMDPLPKVRPMERLMDAQWRWGTPA